MSQIEKKQLLLDAAQKRFAYYGLSKVTMDEIATDVGLSKAAVYYYFKTKEEIFKEVVLREIDQFVNEVRNLVDSKSTALEKLSTFIELRIKSAQTLQNLKKVSMDAGLDLRSHCGTTFHEFATKEHRFISELLSQGNISGEFSVTDPDKTAALIQDIILGLILVNTRIQRPSFKNFDEEHEMFKLMIIKSLQR